MVVLKRDNGEMGTGTRIGVISDTHGLLRPQALAALDGCTQIIHAGDVGKPDVLEALRALAPLHVIAGNIDDKPWAAGLPQTLDLQIDGVRIHVLHDLKTLAPQVQADVIIRWSFAQAAGARAQRGAVHQSRQCRPTPLQSADQRGHAMAGRWCATRAIAAVSGGLSPLTWHAHRRGHASGPRCSKESP